MIPRRSRTEILVESDPSLAICLAALVEQDADVREVSVPKQGLVMCDVRETARNTRFYLGEALMTECRVRIGDTEGLGVVLGGDRDLARALAVIDAACSLAEPLPACEEIERRIAAAGDELARKREREALQTSASRVSFDTMGGQDMSVQAGGQMTGADVLTRDEVLDERAFYLQAAFRALLDAAARPGEISELPSAPEAALLDARDAGLFPATIACTDVLLDAATSVAAAGQSAQAIEKVLARRSHVARQDAERASFAVIPLSTAADCTSDFVNSLDGGTLLDPHRGATCLVECETLLGLDAAGSRAGSASGTRPAIAWELAGPGIASVSAIRTDRADALQARIDRADEYPCGIDLFLVDRAGHVIAVPRSTALRRAQKPIDDERAGKGADAWDM